MAILFILALAAVAFKPSILDFVKANFGLIVLIAIWATLLSASFHVFHEANQNTLGKDFLAWLEQKAGEVLASIMTLIVSTRATNQRASDVPVNGDTVTIGTKTITTGAALPTQNL